MPSELTRVLLRRMEAELNNRSDEYIEEADYMTALLVKEPVINSLPNLDITEVYVVNNNYLKILYELKKEEYRVRCGRVTEVRLYHATSRYNVDSIIKNNFDWRRVTRNKYGIGVSFSDDPDYANFHSNRNNGDLRAFIVADVLIGNKCNGNELMKIPPNFFDTAIGNNNVFVKFNDNEFLPFYVIYYNAPDRTQSKHWKRSFHRRRFF